MRKIILFTLLLAEIFLNINATFKFTNLKCESLNLSVCFIKECRIKAISRDVNYIMYNAALKMRLYNLKVNIQTFKKAAGWRPWLYNITINVCSFLKNRSNLFGALLYSHMANYTNINHSCPLDGDLIIRNLHANSSRFRLPISSGDYRLSLNFTHDKRPINLLEISGRYIGSND